jgi:pimeloyl-ACP methyl ester carboxylesterase
MAFFLRLGPAGKYGLAGAFGKLIENSEITWADGSGWKGVYDILTKDGYNVSIVQEPETSFKDDVEATKRVIAQQDGPCILVAHSYGGAVATEAGNDPSVVGLVYVAAHMPDAGESEAEDGKRLPSDLSKSTGIKRTPDGFTFLDPAQFHDYFAADLSSDQAAFMARSQVPNFADNFKAVITTAAWRNKPSWMLVAGADRTINPELERWYAKRAGLQQDLDSICCPYRDAGTEEILILTPNVTVESQCNCHHGQSVSSRPRKRFRASSSNSP